MSPPKVTGVFSEPLIFPATIIPPETFNPCLTVKPLFAFDVPLTFKLLIKVVELASPIIT